MSREIIDVDLKIPLLEQICMGWQLGTEIVSCTGWEAGSHKERIGAHVGDEEKGVGLFRLVAMLQVNNFEAGERFERRDNKK